MLQNIIRVHGMSFLLLPSEMIITEDVVTINNVSISTTPKNYTIASITPTIPRASLTPDGPVCGESGIPVSFAYYDPINLNYTLRLYR